MKKLISVLVVVCFFLICLVSAGSAQASDAIFSPKEYDELPHAEVEFTLLSVNKPYGKVNEAMISASGNRVVYVSSSGANNAVMVVNSDETGSTEVFQDGKMTGSLCPWS